MKTFTIYQMPRSLWHEHGVFDENSDIRVSDYCAVWTDTIPNNFNDTVVRALELIFENFNLYHPENYAGRSLSTGDIIKIDDDYYLCCSVGWSKL